MVVVVPRSLSLSVHTRSASHGVGGPRTDAPLEDGFTKQRHMEGMVLVDGPANQLCMQQSTSLLDITLRWKLLIGCSDVTQRTCTCTSTPDNFVWARKRSVVAAD